ncbi:hypothetical protein A4D02_18980 [Niastella koreensis]|uniref:Uncharacterized protein n=2 Tax=Niastella koreensis TaxID=354356 RepID=G8TA79_NIAKG|nr:hypothetical protein [Niastella koreensis]AEW03417.1 hypothetical protein Niako_7201 [Niastella koreensis GR20-10]OQP53790.1 hypothetical protein A4D02_18980 [Niastella koreensis]
MKILEKVNETGFPFNWANMDYYPESTAERKEIYLVNDDDDSVAGLIFLFYSLFGDLKNDLKIYSKSWWDFCLDTWNPESDKADYQLKNKSEESQNYLKMLEDSGIEVGYSGCCRCENWDKYLPIVLKCIVSNIAPYSPLFFDKENEFFFYFHSSGSIGMYYKEENETIKKILLKGWQEYEVISDF